MKTRPKIRFMDQSGNLFTVPIYQLKHLTGREWLDLDYSFIDPKECDPFLFSFLKNPLAITRSLEIRYMGDKVGYGLFAAANIPKNTVIGFVSGEFKKWHSNEVVFDPKNPTTLIESGQVSYDDYGNIYIIDSSRKSNHTHYVQHLPSKEMLSELNIINSNIATSNLSEQLFPHDGFEYTYFCANRDIKHGEMIGCSYQINTEERDMDTYRFFSKKGKVIDYPSSGDSSNNTLSNNSKGPVHKKRSNF
jgi:hypothetical protein